MTPAWMNWRASAGGAVTLSLRRRRSSAGLPVLSAMARHGEPPLHGVVGHAGVGAVQLSSVLSQLGAGKTPAPCWQAPPAPVEPSSVGGARGCVREQPPESGAASANASAPAVAPATLKIPSLIAKPPAVRPCTLPQAAGPLRQGARDAAMHRSAGQYELAAAIDEPGERRDARRELGAADGLQPRRADALDAEAPHRRREE